MKIYPSLISADILNLSAVVTQFNSLCDGYHIDIMDGHFVPNLTWGPLFSNALTKKTNLPLHIHLMVTDPTGIAARIAPRQQDHITFHYEAIKNPAAILPTITHLKNMRCHVGMAVNPETPVTAIKPYLEHLDSLIIMSVNPGQSGQAFISSSMEKIEQTIQLRATLKPNLLLIVDGGISSQNIATLAKAGIDACAIASAIFSAPNPPDALKHLYTLAKKQ